jgi:mRNA interferase YafQ
MVRRKPKPPKKASTVPAPPPAPLTPSPTTRFERDVERMRRRGADMMRFKAVIEALCSRRPMPTELRDHALSGEWKGCRDCHVSSDWVVIYERAGSTLILYRTGTHADLFES